MHPDLVALGLALGVGLLVGFERERHPDTVAGVRTFGFAGLIGGLSALLTPDGSTPWVLAAVAVLLGAAATAGGIVVAGRSLRAELEDRSGGRAPRAAEAASLGSYVAAAVAPEEEDARL